MDPPDPERADPDESALTERDRRRVERPIEREEVGHLIRLGLVITVVAGIGSWFVKWEAATFESYGLVEARTIAIPYACNAPVRVDVSEGAGRVVVRVDVRRRSNDQDCGNAVCVHLAEPLGDRLVIDDRTGRSARRSDWPCHES